MSDEKLCGFWRKDARHNFIDYVIADDKLVPVRLCSESVSLEWLEKECEKQDKWAIAGSALRELYFAALKEVEK